MWMMKDAAKRTGYARQYLYNLQSRGQFVKPRLTLGGMKLYDPDKVLSWAAKRKHKRGRK